MHHFSERRRFGLLPALILFAVGAALLPVPAAAHPADDEIPDEPAKAALIADAAALQPGMTFRLGVEFTMVDHWHVYWHSAREGGLGTEILWNLPEGWVAGPLQWPVPRSYELPGPLLAFGYDDAVVVYSDVTIPADFRTSGDTVTLKATLSWLACKEVCVVGKGEPTLELPFGSQKRVDPVRKIVFDTWHQKVPVSANDIRLPLREQLLPANRSESASPKSWQITVDWPGKSPVPNEFRLFPFDLPGATLSEGSSETQGRRTVFQFDLDVYEATEFRPEAVGAVIAWGKAETAAPEKSASRPKSTSRPKDADQDSAQAKGAAPGKSEPSRAKAGRGAIRVVHGELGSR